MEPGLLYESPFTDISPTGPEPLFGAQRTEPLFGAQRTESIVQILRAIRERAIV